MFGITNYGYYIEYINEVYQLYPPVESFEKDVRLGYIRTDMQMINTGMKFVRDTEGEELVSLDALTDQLLALDNCIKLTYIDNHNYPRYRLEFPDFLFDILYEKGFKTDTLFAEELHHLSWIFREQILDFDSLKNIWISDNLRLFDFLKVKRYFLLMQMIFEKKLKEIKNLRTEWLLHTLVTQVNEDQLNALLTKIIKPDMFDDFMEIMCWEQGDDTVLDLQYKPIIFLDKTFLFPFNIIGRMNVVRNLYASEYKNQNKNLVTDGKIDPLVNKLSKCLTEANIQHITQFEYSTGEIDLVAIMDNTMFFIECKHSLHPATVYEMRTTYDYIQKAQIQLDRAVEHYKKYNLIDSIENAFERSLDEVKNVTTLIVTSNRILNGNTFDHPVRDILEFINFISKGTFVTNDGIYSLWESGKFNLQELLKYLREDNIAINHMREVMTKYKKVYRTQSEVLEYESYYFDMEGGLKKLKEFTKDLTCIEKFV